MCAHVRLALSIIQSNLEEWMRHDVMTCYCYDVHGCARDVCMQLHEQTEHVLLKVHLLNDE